MELMGTATIVLENMWSNFHLSFESEPDPRMMTCGHNSKLRFGRDPASASLKRYASGFHKSEKSPAGEIFSSFVVSL